MRLYASLLAADHKKMSTELARAEESGIDGFHIDVIGGHYRKGCFIPLEDIRELCAITSRSKNMHLMVDNPQKTLAELVDLPVDLFFIHLEDCPDPADTLDTIKAAGRKAGMAISLSLPYEFMLQYLGRVDAVNICTVDEIGLGGQTISADGLQKVAQVAQIRKDQQLDFDIYADGGILEANIGEIKAAGADCSILGTALFDSPDMADSVARIKMALRQIELF